MLSITTLVIRYADHNGTLPINSGTCILPLWLIDLDVQRSYIKKSRSPRRNLFHLVYQQTLSWSFSPYESLAFPSLLYLRTTTTEETISDHLHKHQSRSDIITTIRAFLLHCSSSSTKISHHINMPAQHRPSQLPPCPGPPPSRPLPPLPK